MTEGKDNPGLVLHSTEDLHHSNVEQEEEEEEEEGDFENLAYDPPFLMDKLDQTRAMLHSLILQHQKWVQVGTGVVIGVLYNVFFFATIVHFGGSSGGVVEINWCDGQGFLVIVTVLVYVGIMYFYVFKPGANWLLDTSIGIKVTSKLFRPPCEVYERFMSKPYSSLLINVTFLLAILIYLVVDSVGDRRRLVSFAGLLILILIGTLFSKHPGRIVWRHVSWGLALQFALGLLILKWSVGRLTFECLGNKVSQFLHFTDAGSGFIYGYLVDPKAAFNLALVNQSSVTYQVLSDITQSGALNYVLSFKVLSVIYFFSFSVSMLFHLGVMQWVVSKLGWVLQVTIGTTACESMTAAGNIFLGQVEAPLLIKPYIKDMTESEIAAVMTSGFATVSGSILAVYISFNVSAAHLLSASVMSAPAALACSKLIYPESKKSKTRAENITLGGGDANNLLDAASQGATTGVFLVANIIGSLIAFLAFVAFLNSIVNWCGGLLGIPGLSFEYLLGKIFIPVAWCMGVETKDLDDVGTLLGIKTFVNELIAYQRLQTMEDRLSPRSKIIATYALCGFTNPASIGISIATMSTVAPERRAAISKVAFTAFVGGSMACFLTACVAGSLISTS